MSREGASGTGSVHSTKSEALAAGGECAKRDKVELVIHRKKERTMAKRLMRFRVLKESLMLEGVYLPLGDYDGEISWSELSSSGHRNRVRGPSKIAVTRAILEATGQSMPEGVSFINIDASAAVMRGDVVVL